jgi:hypothetical protein
MTPEQKAAFVMSQSVAAQGMIAANQARESQGYAQAYDESAFDSLSDTYLIDSDKVQEFFRE